MCLPVSVSFWLCVMHRCLLCEPAASVYTERSGTPLPKSAFALAVPVHKP